MKYVLIACISLLLSSSVYAQESKSPNLPEGMWLSFSTQANRMMGRIIGVQNKAGGYELATGIYLRRNIYQPRLGMSIAYHFFGSPKEEETTQIYLTGAVVPYPSLSRHLALHGRISLPLQGLWEEGRWSAYRFHTDAALMWEMPRLVYGLGFSVGMGVALSAYSPLPKTYGNHYVRPSYFFRLNVTYN